MKRRSNATSAVRLAALLAAAFALGGCGASQFSGNTRHGKLAKVETISENGANSDDATAVEKDGSDITGSEGSLSESDPPPVQPPPPPVQPPAPPVQPPAPPVQPPAPPVQPPAPPVQPPAPPVQPPAPPAPPPLLPCELTNVALPIKLVAQSDTPKGKWWANTAKMSLPTDAADIRLRITQLNIDDNSPRVWMNGTLVVDKSGEDDDMEAHTLQMNVNVSSAVRAGSNTIKGQVFDRYGAYATLKIFVSGSFRTGQGCRISVD